MGSFEEIFFDQDKALVAIIALFLFYCYCVAYNDARSAFCLYCI